jgi:hypothetical protein
MKPQNKTFTSSLLSFSSSKLTLHLLIQLHPSFKNLKKQIKDLATNTKSEKLSYNTQLMKKKTKEQHEKKLTYQL